MKNKKLIKSVKYSFLVPTAFIVIASVCTFALVEFVQNNIYHVNADYNPIFAIGMVIPMSIIISLISYNALKKTNKKMMKLVEGLEEISKENYNYRITYKESDPLVDIYKEYNKMADSLESVPILKNDFISNFSHEFKTPISSIKGFAEVLLEEDLSDEEQKQYLTIIKNESSRLSNMANKIMLITKLNNNVSELEVKDYSLDKQIKECIKNLDNEINKKKIKVNTKLDKVQYKGNEELVYEVWYNIINNAIKYSNDSGIINITLKKEKDIIVTIEDNGIGIDKEKLNKIYDEYYQTDESHHKDGLGLGLSIVKKILKIVNGKIEVDSEINKGTTFTVKLKCK